MAVMVLGFIWSLLYGSLIHGELGFHGTVIPCFPFSLFPPCTVCASAQFVDVIKQRCHEGPFGQSLWYLPALALGVSVSSQETALFSMGLSCLLPFLPFFFNKAKWSFVASEWISEWLERAPWVPGTCHCLPGWPTFPFRSNYFQMLTDALKKLVGRGRHERKVEKEGDSKQKECRML